ncbi:MAG: glutathione S-transferase family protein [Pseudomonadota bacterium]
MSTDQVTSSASQVRIFGTVISTYTRIVEITCEEVGLPHMVIPTPARSPGNRHPFGKVPVVHVDGLELIESVAITQYLDNQHGEGRLQPGDPVKRAVMDKWVALANNYLFPLFENGLVMPWIMHRVVGEPLDHDKINRALPQISLTLGYIEGELDSDGAWTSCGDFTFADVFIYPIIRGLELTPQGEIGIAQCDRISAWLRTCEKRASITATQWESES